MPSYTYRCVECNDRLELSQTHAEMVEVRNQLRCQRCEGQMQFVFPSPHLKTNTEFLAGWSDGWDDRPDPKRTHAQRVARAAGVNPTGKTFCPGLGAPGVRNDPQAWVPHDDPKGYIKKRCEELNYACEGAVNVKQREPETDPADAPYCVAEDLVQEEVDRIVGVEHEGPGDAPKRADLVEATHERLAGNQ